MLLAVDDADAVLATTREHGPTTDTKAEQGPAAQSRSVADCLKHFILLSL